MGKRPRPPRECDGGHRDTAGERTDVNRPDRAVEGRGPGTRTRLREDGVPWARPDPSGLPVDTVRSYGGTKVPRRHGSLFRDVRQPGGPVSSNKTVGEEGAPGTRGGTENRIGVRYGQRRQGCRSREGLGMCGAGSRSSERYLQTWASVFVNLHQGSSAEVLTCLPSLPGSTRQRVVVVAGE